jgi:hypothetical protein
MSDDISWFKLNFDDSFIQAPDCLTESKGIAVSGTFAKIVSLSHTFGYSFMSNNRIASELGITRPTLNKALKFLLSEGLIYDVTKEILKVDKLSFKQVRYYIPNGKIYREWKTNYLRNRKKKVETIEPLSEEQTAEIMKKAEENRKMLV